MKAIIMAGGEGSRLRPLTCDRPKPMVPLVNRPMMEHIVALLKAYGFTDIGVTLQYLPEQIKNYFGDGRQFGVKMQYFVEDSPLGTAGSVKNSGDFLDETFIVISGDALTDFDLQKAVDFHRQKGGIATLVLTSVETPLEYGVVIADKDGRITRFLEKPAWGEVFSDTVNTGIYILEPEVLDFIPVNKKFDFAQDLFPLLMEKGYTLYGYVAEGYWCDIGNLKQYHEAHLAILRQEVKLALPLTETAPGIYVGEDVLIEPGAEVTAPVVIGSGSRIRRGARVESFSVIGPNCQVEAGATIKRGICWGNTYLGPRTQIRGAILCNGVKVLQGSSVFEGAVVGSATTIEENVTLKPNVKIWPGKQVAASSIVAESIIWGTKPAKSLFGFDGITGIVNLEITPELVTKLCVAYGTLLGEEKQVVISSDDWKASRMLKEAALAGLLSAGVKVIDLGTSVTPITRQAVKELAAAGGIHIRLSRDDNTYTQISFFDADGFNLTKAWERKIEQTFYREDFKRIKALDVGETVKITGFAEKYRESLLKQLEVPLLNTKKRRVLLAYPTPWLYSFLAPLLQQLNCELVTLSLPEGEPLTLRALRAYCDEVGEAVRQTNADLGVMMDTNAESLILFDRRGRVVADEMFMALTSAVVFRSTTGGTVVVPITAPGVIEKLAERHKGKVLRTKTAPRALMEAMAKEKGANKYDLLVFAFDAIAALATILEFLASEEIDLTELVDSIPPFYLQKTEVDCAWGAKGAVMRRLIEDTRNSNVELLDGVKVKHEKGWALVLPDPDKPLYRIYSEGYDAETAAELTDLYRQKIVKYQAELKPKAPA
ncbi:MAG: NTP transferase domain-containing protein [Firmicutes bacterium]|nr:NTP transferase domain-containing protein [Bacillota bacterium]